MAEGFCLTVGFMTPTFINKEEIIRLFQHADYKSNHYNKQTGLYTAPLDGVYVFSLMTTNQGAVLCMDLKDKSGEEIPKAVCRMKYRNISVSAVFPIPLYKDAAATTKTDHFFLNLEVLENVRQKVASLDKSIKDVIEKGEKWLNEDDNVQTFVQMNQMIVDENSRCLRICRDIANEKEETDPTNKDESLNTEISETKPDLTSTVKGSVENDTRRVDVEEVSTDMSTMKDFIQTTERNYSTLSEQLETLTKSLSKKVKSLQKRNTEQDNKIEEMVRRQSVSETRTDSKFDDVMSELHTASDFIKYQTDMLSEKVQKCEECNETILNEHKILESNLKLNVDSLTKQIQSCQESTTNLSTSVTQNKSSMESTFEKLQNKCTDIDDKILQFSNDLDQMSTEMIGQMSNNTAECFCVRTGNLSLADVKQDKIGTLFMDPFSLYDTQNYDTSTGTYTTPYDGLFLVSLMIENKNVLVPVKIYIVTKDSSEVEKVRNLCIAESKRTVSTCFPLILKRHEKLFLKGIGDYQYLVLGPNTTFSCILISKM